MRGHRWGLQAAACVVGDADFVASNPFASGIHRLERVPPVWAVLEQIAVGTPWLLLCVIGMIALAILLSLLISLRNAETQERPEIIRALAELMHFWRRR
ncbi:hypothetical protein [Streptomyces sp. NBC_00258]|uniref:hypothetical protein n=1 Tax=Streptomyces sp. NBC_00258 TaxID=2903642 RepID=UPI002E2DDEEF|nr:hypothetical protein [Streptomyces sp. NBC_00258]